MKYTRFGKPVAPAFASETASHRNFFDIINVAVARNPSITSLELDEILTPMLPLGNKALHEQHCRS
jgi:hypothetical protein